MKDFSQFGVTQRGMSVLSSVTNSTISRALGAKGINPLPSSALRNWRYSIGDTRRIISDIYTSLTKVILPIQAFYNFKGGTGKTSICYQVSSHLALMGYKVLVIDADPQGHLSTSYGFNNSENYCTLYDVVSESLTINDVIKEIYPGLFFVPSNLSLTRIEVLLNQMPKREERISMILESIKSDYDFIFFDTNPTISQLNRNIITCSDCINIVCETQPYSLNGLKLLVDDINTFFHSMRIEPKKITVIPNKYEDRMSSSAEAMTALREFYAENMKPDFAVRKSEDINTSAKNSTPLAFFTKMNSIAFEDIVELIHYILSYSTVQKEIKKELKAS